MKDAVDRVIGVIDENGVIVSCSELGMIGETRHGIREQLMYASRPIIEGGYTYGALGKGAKLEYVLFVEGEDRAAEKTLLLISVALSNLREMYDEKYDRSSFIKNVILDNILPSDIYIKSKELHFEADVPRVAYLIRFFGKNEALPYEMIENLFPDKTRDFVISIAEREVVLVKELRPAADARVIEKVAHQIQDTITGEFYAKACIGIGTPAENLKELSRSYKEAQIAIEVGRVFDTEKNIINYENLGIGRLIYQLPTTLCEMFLQEVFRRGSLDNLDRETLATIQCFFENNLNVSETSRKLFVHRNTLVYRLEKIKKLTGLDLREFDHAITFKVALMVKRYLSTKPLRF